MEHAQQKKERVIVACLAYRFLEKGTATRESRPSLSYTDWVNRDGGTTYSSPLSSFCSFTAKESFFSGAAEQGSSLEKRSLALKKRIFKNPFRNAQTDFLRGLFAIVSCNSSCNLHHPPVNCTLPLLLLPDSRLLDDANFWQQVGVGGFASFGSELAVLIFGSVLPKSLQ